jgi:hypothetical protein
MDGWMLIDDNDDDDDDDDDDDVDVDVASDVCVSDQDRWHLARASMCCAKRTLSA